MEYKLAKVPMVGTIMTGTILNVEEGKVKDFVENTTKWGDPEQSCIQLTMGSTEGKSFTRIFTRSVNEQGEIYPNSNLGKFFIRYGGFPTANMVVSLQVNAKGWLDLML